MKRYFLICVPILVGLLGLTQLPKELTISFMGDVMLGRLVDKQIKQTSDSYPWGNLISELKMRDLIVANLETTLTQSTTIVPKVFNFKADPSVVQTLLDGNIGVVNLANNHSLDFGTEGLKETVEILDHAKIKHVGAGLDIAEAQKPVIITINNTKIGILGYTDNEPTWLATTEKPGTNYIDIDSSNYKVFEAVQNLKNQVDLCIVTIHWGPNMREYPSEQFVNFAHKLIDSGADIIHGHSAHIVQGIEQYHNKIILYDTGDFVDDYMVDSKLRNDLSFLFTIEIVNKKLKKLILLPVKINNMQVNKATGSDAEIIINFIKKRSSQFNTSFEQKNNKLVLAF